jgi:hypothetical protein
VGHPLHAEGLDVPAVKGAERAEPFRIFVAGTDTRVVQAAPGVEEAMDIMMADGYPAERAAELCVAAEKSGRDPVAFARHFVSLRQAVRP